jgi:glycerol uptake facilitator-like aquaporin
VNRARWIHAQAAGATAAQFVVYSDSDAHCKALTTADGPPHSSVPVTYPFLENFVIKFKDEASASREYSGSVFGIPPTAYGNLDGGIVGAATGLGLNSESYLCTGCGSYTALWQNNAFDVVIWIVNLDSATRARIVSNVNSRID